MAEQGDKMDPNQKEHMRKLIKSMGKDKTIIISTHLLDEAEIVANRIVLINSGEVVIDGTIKDIINKTKKTNLEDAFKLLTYSE
jgi:ABC-2 type transport system ATP-binding protein